MGTLGQALTLTILLLLTRHWNQGSADHVISVSGKTVWLRPSASQINISKSVTWKVQQFFSDSKRVILTWKGDCCPKYEPWVSDHFNNRLNFTSKDLAISIKAAQQQDSGFYFLESTDVSGKVWKTEFQVSVFDPVENPLLQWDSKALNNETCELNLSCSVSRNENVSYSWYRGSKLIQTPGNLTHLVELIDVNGLHTYTCNVSNPGSWANNTLILTQACLSAHQNFRFLSLPVIISVILLVILFLGTLTSFCVWRRKRKRSRERAEDSLTVYEVINNLQIRRNQEQEQGQGQEQEQNFHGEGKTIYARIKSQGSGSTSQKMENTIYSTVEPFRKSGSKKKNNSPPSNCTIYEEVGKSQLRAQNPARLSRKELQILDIYS
ncbi:natural killer cell receptor 2B4 isoform X1 [Elephas maximus indicus]|uniref:natural killer cell receptor 2B4 isoform X1 n=1 Tax=Elephas maximus indicus TaxID=99487 RepID=UPI0021170A6E|nr:natural killer cell receptor 2B4 isoform X1 [Elephas maximus indicus]